MRQPRITDVVRRTRSRGLFATVTLVVVTALVPLVGTARANADPTGDPTSTPTPTDTGTATATPTPTDTPTDTPTATPTDTPTDPPTEPPPYTPPSGPLFSDPTTTGTEGPDARRIVDTLTAMIENSPPGSTIRIVTLRLNVPAVTTALVAAHQRGVTVRVVLPADQRSDTEAHTVAAELNQNRLAATDTSYVVFCTLACYDNQAFSTAHAKVYLFSSTGTARAVTMTSSANISKSGYHTAFNDAFVTVGNDAMYTAARRYVDGMKRDRTPARNPYYSVSDAGMVMKFFPDFVSGAKRDQVSSIVNNIHCRAGAGTGDGQGHTLVTADQPSWSSNREYVLDRLKTLHSQGCVVKVMITRGGVTPYMMRRFLHSGLQVRYTDHFQGDFRTLYAHSKYIQISGGFYGNPSARTVFTGSANMTLTATRASDNTMLRIRDDAGIYASYAANFDHIWSLSTPLRSTNATITTAQRRASVVE